MCVQQVRFPYQTCTKHVRFPYQWMALHVLRQIGQTDHPVSHVLLKRVAKATHEEGDGVTGGQVVLHLGVVAGNGQHLENNTSGLKVSHRLSLKVGAVKCTRKGKDIVLPLPSPSSPLPGGLSGICTCSGLTVCKHTHMHTHTHTHIHTHTHTYTHTHTHTHTGDIQMHNTLMSSQYLLPWTQMSLPQNQDQNDKTSSQ